ncbi:FAD-dependent oxidoreductase [Sphaerisporangium viridialbum]|uniref:FAD-dependent oxidoreductase n=1 Tax=Sphaerisporangium viridialbum TaxID=46189 RepID=UPI003C77BCA2
MLRQRFAGWGWPVEQVLASLGDGDPEVFPHTRHKVPSRWGDGRCVLLGDAAHGMPPVMAQGTNQSLEDVATLVDCLSAVPDPTAVVGVYSSKRRRQAALASTVASRSLAVSGPRTLMQSEYLMRMNAATPPRLATQAFGLLLRTLSNRIRLLGRTCPPRRGERRTPGTGAPWPGAPSHHRRLRWRIRRHPRNGLQM